MHSTVIGTQALKRGLHALEDLGPAGIVGVDLRDQEQLLAVVAANRLAYKALGRTRTVHLGRVDKPYARIEPCAQGGKLAIVRVRALPQIPGPHAKARHGGAIS